MADTDDRTFEQYRVVGRALIADGKTGEDVGKGGVVNLDPEPYIRKLATGEVQEVAGVNVKALLAAGHIAPLEDDKPAQAKGEKKV